MVKNPSSVVQRQLLQRANAAFVGVFSHVKSQNLLDCIRAPFRMYTTTRPGTAGNQDLHFVVFSRQRCAPAALCRFPWRNLQGRGGSVVVCPPAAPSTLSFFARRSSRQWVPWAGLGRSQHSRPLGQGLGYGGTSTLSLFKKPSDFR